MKLDILRDALKIDPLDCFPNASYEPLRHHMELAIEKTKTRNTKFFPRMVRFLAFVRSLARSIPYSSSKCEPDVIKHCFFGLTHNQRTSLSPIVTVLNERQLESTKIFSSEDIRLLTKTVSWWAVLFLPCLLVRMLREKGYRGKSFRWAFDDYWRAYGFYVLLRCWFRSIGPKTITVSNDHSLIPCVINKAARDEGIPTFYIQHACVTEQFPPLKMDFALLEGIDALEKYSAVSNGKTSIRLIGIPKFDAFANHVNNSTKCQTAGICFSVADDLDRSLELLKALGDIKGIKFVVRPHMAMTKKAKSAIADSCAEFQFGYSQHEHEHSFDFLRKIDVLISGTSSIALEAVLLNVTALNYVLNPKVPDWYGFIKNGLIISTDSVVQLKVWLTDLKSNRPNIRATAKRYCATIETEYAGRSAELAAQIIESSGEANPLFEMDNQIARS